METMKNESGEDVSDIIENRSSDESENISNSGLISNEIIDITFAKGSANNETRKRKGSSPYLTRAAPKKCSVYIPQSVFVKSLKNGMKKGWDVSMDDFKWEKGKVQCVLCKSFISKPTSHLKQHISGKKHKTSKQRKEDEKHTFSRTQLIENALRESNSTLEDRERSYRINALLEVAKANIAIDQLGEIKDWIQSNAKPGLRRGSLSNMASDFAKPALDILIKEMHRILRRSYPEFSLTIDGTPSFAKAECVLIRFVTKQWEIVEIFVRVALFENAPNSENFAHHIVSCINK